MEARGQRQIKSGKQYNHLFPQPLRRDPIVKRNAGVLDTVQLVKQVVRETLADTEQLAPLLTGRSLDETCRNIWQFVYDHIRYFRDAPGVEQVRRPARSWADRATGVDCDCYTTFISSLLTNLGIAHTLRITEYAHKGYFQHIYPIVYRSVPLPLSAPDPAKSQPPSRNHYLVLDCVKDAYDDEEPYTKHQDFPMNMQYLDGLGNDDSADMAMAGLDDYLIDGLGKVRRRRGKKVEAQALNPKAPEASRTWVIWANT
jgi:hypothetical protein